MKALRSPYPPNGHFIGALRGLVAPHYQEALEPARPPSAETLSALVNTAFWASLRSEENVYARVALSLLEPKSRHYERFCLFVSPLDYSVETLVKLSPLFSDSTTRLGVWPAGRERMIQCWGICHKVIDRLDLRSDRPGHLVLSINGRIVADVLPGQRPRLISPANLDWDFRISLFMSGIDGMSESDRFRIAHHLRFLASAMQHGRGGTVLLVPDNASSWKASLDIKYEIELDKMNLEGAYGDWEEESKEQHEKEKGRRATECLDVDIMFLSQDMPAEREYKRVAQTLGRATAIDGATVMTRSFRLLGFGAKILSHSEPPSAIYLTDPADPSGEVTESDIPLAGVGGMRHRSAIQFVQDNPEALALVASQDGRVTLFRCEDYSGVLAISCESLRSLPD